MTTTLEEAWGWYRAAAESLRRVERVGRKYWSQPAIRELLGKDDTLRDVSREAVEEGAKQAREPLDDLAVLVLFSVFESIVRDAVRGQVAGEAEGLRHPSLLYAAQEALSSIEDGSFFRVLEPYKDRDAGLIEEVNQVRRYRNWVAHGRRGNPLARIDPRSAYDRLSRFLELIVPSPPALGSVAAIPEGIP
jgi:hypothetical protein